MIKHMGAKVLKYKHAPIRMLPKKYRDRTIIGCVRNPFSWYVSYYTYHRTNGYFNNISFDKYINDYTKSPRALLSLMPPKVRKRFPLVYPPDTKMEIGAFTFHYINYFSYKAFDILRNWDVEKLEENIAKVSDLDVMWRTESLNKYMIATFGEKYGGKINNFPRKNVSNKKPYQEFYTPATIDMVESRERILLEYLKYEYEC